MNGILSTGWRLGQRDHWGALGVMLEAAQAERDAGRLANAWVLGYEALQWALRTRWLYASGKAETSISDPVALAGKLRSHGSLDASTLKLVALHCKKPDRFSGAVVDTLLALVGAIGLEIESEKLPPADPQQDGDLLAICAAWPKLPAGVKRGLVMIANSAAG